jgi:hypothetical protein
MNFDIEASPTKGFFVDMITRDIPLDRAILDLIDNSIDGAHRLVNDDNFEGLFVKISLSKDSFIIEDNCGGIPIDIAKHQAFRFGKPKSYTAPEHSIGRFGIGMKRALFKMGKKIEVNSVHENSTFSLNLDVENWLKQEEWDFNFTKKQENMNNAKSICFTKIVVENLHKNISAELEEHYFLEELKKQIAFAHSLIIQKGFKIFINENEVERKKFNIKYGENLKPLVVTIPYETEDKKEVSIKIIAGLDNRDLNKGGWYIFCNNRLILDADKTEITGWNTQLEDNKDDKVNKYHADFAYFRGYVIFDSKDAGSLPWTTTKTGLNADSEVYKAAYFEMRKILKVILIFLSARNKEYSKFKRDEIDSSPLTTLIEEKTDVMEFYKITVDEKFYANAPQPNITEKEPEPEGGTITYWKPKEELDLLKKYLKVSTNKDVGIATFDYYLTLISE